MHNGFYIELENLQKEIGDTDFGYLENELIEDNIHAYKFLHGFCDIFALALNELFGYTMECIEDEDKNLIHAYCKVSKEGKDLYIDVRGITTDYPEFIEEFNDFVPYFDIPVYPVEGTRTITKNPKIKDEILLKHLSAAKNLIKTYENYYKVL